ncbi:MAG: hypothetical protein AAGL10_15510 [Pseudomonadota bacterium]
MSSVQDQAAEGLRIAKDGLQQAVDRIPPDAWPIIDILFRVTIALAILWVVLSLIGWWRRRAYNLTVASTAGRNKKAQPDFLNVDEKARKEQIKAGERHEDVLEDREKEEALAALKAAKEPVTLASRLASAATFVMSLITLLTGFSGAILGIGRIEGQLAQAGTAGKLEYLITEHTIGCIIVAFVIGYKIWRFVAEKKWKKA